MSRFDYFFIYTNFFISITKLFSFRNLAIYVFHFILSEAQSLLQNLANGNKPDSEKAYEQTIAQLKDENQVTSFST